MPPNIRVNSIAVSTSRLSATGRRVLPDNVAQMLIDQKYGPEKLAGIQYLPHRQIIVLKFHRNTDYASFLELDTVRIQGVPCKLYDLSSQFTTVTIMGAPFEMEKDDLVALLSCYGEVKTMRKRLMMCEKAKEYCGIPDGTWIAVMDIKDRIPSYLNLRDNQLFIRYNGQEKTCRICNSNEHIARECTANKKTSTIEINRNNFPTIAETQQNASTKITMTDTSEQTAEGPADDPPPPAQSTPTITETTRESPITDPTTTDTTEPAKVTPVDDPTTRDPPNIEQQATTSKTQDVSRMPPPATPTKTTRRALLQQDYDDVNTAPKGRAIKKRKTTPGKPARTPSKTPSTKSTPTTSPNQLLPRGISVLPDDLPPFIDLDKNYIITFEPRPATDTET